MLFVDGSISTYRESSAVNADGTLSNRECDWDLLQTFKCVCIMQVDDKLEYRDEMEVNVSNWQIEFDTMDQDPAMLPLDLKKTDYVGFVYKDNPSHTMFFKVMGITQDIICPGECCYKIQLQRIEPRECPPIALHCGEKEASGV